MLLPDGKLVDKSQAIASVRRLAQLSKIEAVLVGDGWQIFHDGHIYLQGLIDRSISFKHI
jgi:hypothetical protein